MEQLDLHFKLNENEYVEAVQNYILKKNKIKTDIIVSLSLIGLGISIWGYSGYSIFWLISILIGIFFILSAFVIYYIIPPRRFKQDPMLYDENSLLINKENIILRFNNKQSKLQWADYKEILENQKYFYLVYGRNLYTIIPKRAFDSDELDLFKNLVEGRLALKLL